MEDIGSVLDYPMVNVLVRISKGIEEPLLRPPTTAIHNAPALKISIKASDCVLDIHLFHPVKHLTKVLTTPVGASTIRA